MQGCQAMQGYPVIYRRFAIGAGVAILALGLLFRCTHLSTKVYWHDEVYTSLWLSGSDPSHHVFNVFDGREISPSDLLGYQHLHPHRGIARTVRALARNDPQHPPLYYALAWLSARCCGDTTTTIRALSVLFGILTLPATYWLCLEALRSHRAAWIGTLLVSVSPIHLLYSQEAREYSLWALMITLSSAALLRASRSASRSPWVLYAALTLVGLYTHGLHLLVMLAHGVWMGTVVIAVERRGDANGRYLFARYLTATIVPAMLFAPWAYVIVKHRSQIETCVSWMKESSRWGSLVALWGTNFASVFVDGMPDPRPLSAVALTILRVAVLVIGLGSLLVSWRYLHRRAWFLSALLAVLPLLVMATPDVLWGGQRSVQGRFLFPGYVGMILATVHFLTAWLESPKLKARLCGVGAALFLLAAGIISCTAIWQANTWWNKGENWSDRLQAIDAINQSPQPLVLSGPISRDEVGHTIGLGHLLNAHVRLRVVLHPDIDRLAHSDYTHVYLTNVSEDFLAQLRAQICVEPLTRSGEFYMLHIGRDR